MANKCNNIQKVQQNETLCFELLVFDVLNFIAHTRLDVFLLLSEIFESQAYGDGDRNGVTAGVTAAFSVSVDTQAELSVTVRRV